MADAQPIGERACVECGAAAPPRRSPHGPTPMRCDPCSRGRHRYHCRAGAVKDGRSGECAHCGESFVYGLRGPRQLACSTCTKEKRKQAAAVGPRLGCCADCGLGIISTSPGRVSRRCEQCTRQHRNHRPRTQLPPHTCEGCGSEFRPSGRDRTRYCSRDCAFRHRSKDPVWLASIRTAIDARRKVWPHTRVWFPTCPCGETFSTGDRRKRICTPGHEEAPRSKACSECSREYRPEHGGRLTCSDQCKRARNRRVTKANPNARRKKAISRKAGKLRRRGARVEAVDPIRVFDRDGWRCQDCGRATPQRLRGTYEARAPELDHIIPIARGGEHSYRNTRCCCRECNGRKGDRERGQLLLFG